MELQEFINSICEELNNPEINKQRKRYLETYLQELLQYQNNNPDKEEIPTHLQLYCNLNPNALECREYDL
jgi:hypothetical protein